MISQTAIDEKSGFVIPVEFSKKNEKKLICKNLCAFAHHTLRRLQHLRTTQLQPAVGRPQLLQPSQRVGSRPPARLLQPSPLNSQHLLKQLLSSNPSPNSPYVHPHIHTHNQHTAVLAAGHSCWRWNRRLCCCCCCEVHRRLSRCCCCQVNTCRLGCCCCCRVCCCQDRQLLQDKAAPPQQQQQARQFMCSTPPASTLPKDRTKKRCNGQA